MWVQVEGMSLANDGYKCGSSWVAWLCVGNVNSVPCGWSGWCQVWGNWLGTIGLSLRFCCHEVKGAPMPSSHNLSKCSHRPMDAAERWPCRCFKLTVSSLSSRWPQTLLCRKKMRLLRLHKASPFPFFPLLFLEGSMHPSTGSPISWPPVGWPSLSVCLSVSLSLSLSLSSSTHSFLFSLRSSKCSEKKRKSEG